MLMNPLPLAIDLPEQAGHAESEGELLPICPGAPIPLDRSGISEIL